ncbi:MMS19 nucleotide excision repair protein homolog [Diachasma alloeum]|uniref:MMS19 nucleotide excision repair protein homolog n=1 Tax=Diachasma alloeum TaxID=454923 RepID=UPI0007381A4E|nr:MMS19 nucleotide excision repair protein homolog [Diachasma alloeum]
MAPTRNTIIVERLSSVFSTPENKEDLSEVCGTISSDILAGSTKLCDVVEQLGEFLTSTDISLRENGVRSLSTIIQKLPQDFLSPQELELLTSFYCDRLKDHHSIIPSVILGLLSLVQMTNLPADAPGRLVHTLAQHVRCQSELQETRRNIYLIFQTLLDTRIDALKALGPDFVYIVISSMDGESDPRNLLLLFGILPKFMKEFPLGHLTEEMFEVIACYFPIDFTSGGKEGKGITREDLSRGLERCLSALPSFSDSCIPLLLEKLDSSLKTAKLDSLSLLSTSCSTFGVAGLKEHLDEIWIMLRREVMPGSDQDVRTMGLQAITDVSRVLSGDPIVSEKFVGKILTDTKSSFCDVQLSLFWPAEKLLEAVAKGGKESCIHVLRAVIPLSLGQYSTKTRTADKISLMETLNSFIKISGAHGFKISDVPELSWTDIPNLYLNELHEGENALKARALVGLAAQVSSLSEPHRQGLYGRLCEEIDAGGEELEAACHLVLSVYGREHCGEVQGLLQERLKVDVDVPGKLLENRLKALSSVAKIPDLGAGILPCVLGVAVSGGFESSSAALRCLQGLLLDEKGEFDVHNYLEHDCGAVERLVESVGDGNVERMRLVANICCLIVRKLRPEAQRIVVERHFRGLRARIAEDIVLLEGILTPLAPEVVETIPIDVLEQFFEISLKSPDGESRSSACRLVSILVNKIGEGETLGRHLRVFREVLTQILEGENGGGGKRAAVVMLTWLTKSLILRGSRESQDFLDYQINVLKNEDVGEFAGEMFRVLIDRGERTLTEENRCAVKIFYKQRVFQSVIQQNGQFEGAARQNYLIALSHLVQEIPVELMSMHLMKIVPSLVESLSMESNQLLLSTLTTLEQLLNTKHDIFIEQIQSFIPRCLNLSTHPKMQIRIAALNCLHSYCSYPTTIIKMYKNDVIDKLSETIDDKKRLVRRVAVKTRTRWYLVGASGGPD